jgi:hypothetical protein
MIRLKFIKNFAATMGDAIADHYSQSHSSGGKSKMGITFGYSIPLVKQKESLVEKFRGNASVEAKDYANIASMARKAQKGKKYSESDSEVESKRAVNPKKKKKIAKHKRSRIDDALGDDTY